MVYIFTTEERKEILASFAILEWKGSKWVTKFYERLFADYPETKHFFPQEVESQTRKFSAMLLSFTCMLGDIESMRPVLEDLGRFHAVRNIKPEDYTKVRATLLNVLKEELGDDFTLKLRGAWIRLYEVLAAIMIGAGMEQSDKDTISSIKLVGREDPAPVAMAEAH